MPALPGGPRSPARRTKLDRSALAAYGQVYARWVEAEEQIKTHGA